MHQDNAVFWLSAKKNLGGSHCFLRYCSYCSFYCFSKILGGGKSGFGGGHPCPPVAESQVFHSGYSHDNIIIINESDILT